MSTERDTSGAFLFLDFKFMNNLRMTPKVRAFEMYLSMFYTTRALYLGKRYIFNHFRYTVNVAVP